MHKPVAPAMDDALVEKVARAIDPRVFHDHRALYEYCLLCGDSDEVAQKTADDTHKPGCDATRVIARAVLAIPDLRLAGVKEGLEMAGQYSLNVNETVQVKLTDAGREYHRKWHQRQYPMIGYRPPDESDDGWSKWQLWTLMKHFGAGVFMGGPMLFETEIRFDATAIRSLGPRP